MTFVEDLERIFAKFSRIKLAILFGSTALGRPKRESNLDVAVAADTPFLVPEKTHLIEALGRFSGRPIDLIDLQSTGGLILRQWLTTGRSIRCTDRSLYAEILKKMLFNQADFMPYRRRILGELRSAWIGK
jgi:predicted nucleotidyltransferase